MRVRRDASDPVGQLLDEGETLASLAVAWELKNTETVRRLRSFVNPPRFETAEHMAKSFGWPSAGAVMDFWAKKVREKKEKKSDAASSLC